jgi:flagellar biosynthesis anti-sigma factor FlgM
MKVPESNRTNPSSTSSVSALRSSGHATTLTGSGRAPGTNGRADHVEISALSAHLNTLDSQSAAHASKLMEVTSAVSAGRYHVDANVLSDRMIQEHMRPAA